MTREHTPVGDAPRQTAASPFYIKRAPKNAPQIIVDPETSVDFKAVAEHIYDGVYVTDGKGKTLYVNPGFTRITGIRYDEVIGYTIDELVSSRLFVNAVTPEVLRQKKEVNAISYVPRTKMHMLITGAPIFDEDGNVKNVVVIDREINELITVKGELEASRKKIQCVRQYTKKTRRELEYLRKQQTSAGMVGSSKATEHIRQQIDQAAEHDVTVLLVGETGVGKEVVANEIHQHSKRANEPFIKINCAAIPATMLEAELFGYEKGSFTGADSRGRIGLFESAEKGTILLDEIGDTPLELQAKLLRAIQHKEITRIGGRAPIALDVRIIAATNVNLKEKIRDKLFREDLFYRINILQIQIPPLRDRTDDIPDLIAFFLEKNEKKYNKSISISPNAIQFLSKYEWPGNVRELQNIIERLSVVSSDHETINEQQISGMLGMDEIDVFSQCDLSFKERIQNLEKKIIERALQLHGSTRLAAKALKMDQSTIVKKRKSWDR